jgi:hypothetical protein
MSLELPWSTWFPVCCALSPIGAARPRPGGVRCRRRDGYRDASGQNFLGTTDIIYGLLVMQSSSKSGRLYKYYGGADKIIVLSDLQSPISSRQTSGGYSGYLHAKLSQ